MSPKARRNSTVEQLPAELFAKVRAWIRDGRTYAEIRELLTPLVEKWNAQWTQEQTAVPSTAALSRYYTSREAKLIAEEAARDSMVKDMKAQIVAALEVGGDNEAVDAILNATILSNRARLEEADPEALIGLHMRSRALELKEKTLEIQQQRLEHSVESLQFKIQQYRDRVADENGLELPPPHKIYEHVVEQALEVLKTYGELRPLLQKYSRQIATRLATEAQRFEWTELTGIDKGLKPLGSTAEAK